MRKRLLLIATSLALLVVVACADEASAPTDEALPSSQQGTDDLAPPKPELADGVLEIGRKRVVIAPSPGFPYSLTPYEIQVGGEEQPPCDRFVFGFGWRVVDPREPEPDFGLSWEFSNGGQPQEIGRGPSGVAEVGCGVLTVTNETDQDISVAVDYVVGEKP